MPSFVAIRMARCGVWHDGRVGSILSTSNAVKRKSTPAGSGIVSLSVLWILIHTDQFVWIKIHTTHLDRIPPFD